MPPTLKVPVYIADLPEVLAALKKAAKVITDLEGEVGDLIDALHDELPHEVRQSPHVMEHVRRVCELLSSAYQSYVEDW